MSSAERKGFNTHGRRVSHAARLIAVAPEDDIVSQRLHGDIGDATAQGYVKYVVRMGSVRPRERTNIEAGVIDAEVLEDGYHREVPVVRAPIMDHETVPRKATRDLG